MHAQTAIKVMLAYYVQLETLLERFASVVDDQASDNVILAGLRWQLVRLLREYQLFKHTEIFDPVCRGGQPTRKRHALELKGKCENVGASYNAFIKQWNLGGYGPSSEEYRQAAKIMLREVRQHLAAERIQITALLEQLGELRDMRSAS